MIGKSAARSFFLAILGTLAAVAPSGAVAAVEICNQFKGGSIRVAMARVEKGRVTVRGWYIIAPGDCSLIDREPGADGHHAFFAMHESSNNAWPRDETGDLHCVKFGPRFTVAYPAGRADARDLNCGDGYVKRRFTPVTAVEGKVKLVFE